LHPSFPEDQVTREKALQLAALRRSLDDARERPLQLYRAAMFPGHPYGLPDRGDEKTLAKIDRAALQAWWKASVAADRMLVVVVGNVDPEDVRRKLDEKLSGLARSGAKLAPPPVPAPPAEVRESVEQRDRKQTAMIAAFPGPAPSEPSWHAFRLLQYVTSGLSGTFFRELRARRSLAYSVSAAPQAYAGAGTFITYLASEAGKEEVARRSMLAEIHKLQGEGDTEADVARAKPYFAGTTRIARETTGARVTEYGRNYVLSVPLDHVDRTLEAASRLGVEDLRAAARRYLAGDNYVFAAVRGK
jgi:zinc protease